MIYIIGITITFFLSLILWTKKGKSSADRILLTWLCVTFIQLILFSIISSNEYLNFPFLLGFEIPLPLLHGPFLFLYTLALSSGQITRQKMLIHFLPYAIGLISTLPFIFLSPKEKILVYQNEGKGFETLLIIIFAGIILSGSTYTVLSLSVLKNYNNKLKDSFSSIEKINLHWLFRLVLGLSLIWIFVFFADYEVTFSFVVLFVIFIGYYGIKHVGIFTNRPPLELSDFTDDTKTNNILGSSKDNMKYENSSLTEQQSKDIHQKLAHLMKEKKRYLTPELTLAMISEELDIHPNKLSQVINSVEQKNFFDYINILRIEEFKVRVANPDNQKYTMLSLALECGFNSKTSFNRNFKNHTGKSPSQYCKEIQLS